MVAQHFGVGSIPWSPIARGLLTRPLAETSKRAESDSAIRAYLHGAGTSDVVRDVAKVAEKRGVSMAQVALAWILRKDGMCYNLLSLNVRFSSIYMFFLGVTAPIIGITSLKHLEEAVDALRLRLTSEEVKVLEQSYVPRTVFGH